MRVIAGTLGGRTFDSPHTARTHPMSDKIRGALFNMLGDIEDLTVLDAFSGTGALSLEAISRGASHATAIESDATAQRTILANIALLSVQDNIKLVRTSANAWLRTNADATFDLVFLDPPYDDVQLPLLTQLARATAPDGTLIVSWPMGQLIPEFEGLSLVKKSHYADAQLLAYQ